jgi:hypothetical protein
MKIDFGPSSFNLARDGVVLLHQAAGARVVCLTGALWLTQQGLAEDVILQAGESLRVTSGGLTLVTALRGSEVRVIQPGMARSAIVQRLLQLLPKSLARVLPAH